MPRLDTDSLRQLRLEDEAGLLCSRCALKAGLPVLEPIQIRPVSLTCPEFVKGVA